MRAAYALMMLVPLAAPAAAQRAPDWNRAETVRVTMSERGFVPRQIFLKGRRAYVLVFANRGVKPHSFDAGSFWRDAYVAPRDRWAVADGKVALRPGGRATVRIVAPGRRDARYTFRSSEVDDALDGYKGWIMIR